MITKAQAKDIVLTYIQKKKRAYTDVDAVDNIKFSPNETILRGERAGEVDDVFVVGYGQPWGLDSRSIYVHISATSGEVLYSLSPHGWVEELEND